MEGFSESLRLKVSSVKNLPAEGTAWPRPARERGALGKAARVAGGSWRGGRATRPCSGFVGMGFSARERCGSGHFRKLFWSFPPPPAAVW